MKFNQTEIGIFDIVPVYHFMITACLILNESKT